MDPNKKITGGFDVYPAPASEPVSTTATPKSLSSQEHMTNNSPQPQPVVKVFSTRGVEYFLMFLALGATALAFGSVLHNLVARHFGLGDGYSYVSQLYSYDVATLVVAFPIFTILFFRLKRAEVAEAKLKNDPSRHRCVQLTLIISFLIGIQKLISYAHSLLNSGGNSVSYYSNNGGGSVLAHTLDLLITIIIAGGIFTYYWLEGHTKKSR